MRKLAIIGGSNSFIENGYAMQLQAILGTEQCASFPLGSSSVLHAVFALLEHNIVNEYEYVIIQFNPTDTIFVQQKSTSPAFLVSQLCYIAKIFKDSQSVPIFLLLNCPSYPIQMSMSFLVRAICSILELPVIDLEAALIFIKPDDLTYDGMHYPLNIQSFIANQIFQFITNNSKTTIKAVNCPTYSILDKKYYRNLPSKQTGTSLINHRVFGLGSGNSITIPEDIYLAGIGYWLDHSMFSLNCKSSCLNLRKDLRFYHHEHLFLERDIGFSGIGGLKGCIISAGDKSLPAVEEYAHPVRPEISESTPLWIYDILLADRDPYEAGLEFQRSYSSDFEMERAYLATLEAGCQHPFDTPCLRRINELMHQNSSFLCNILLSRLDLIAAFLDLRDVEFKAEQYLFWAWRFRHTQYELSEDIEESLRCALQNVFKSRSRDDIPLLIHAIYQDRPDLHVFDLGNANGKSQLTKWFYDFGIHEYGLEFLHDQ